MHHIKQAIGSGFDIKYKRFTVFAILFFSILRGIRFPNMWSYSIFLFNYDFGLIKRGLIGEIIYQLNNPYLMSYEFFVVFSIVIFSINIILLSMVINDFINTQNSIFIGCSAVFASSFSIVFLSHTVGYFDHIGLLISLITLKINGFYKKLLFSSLFIPLAVLIHEAIFIIFFPVIFMSLLFSIEPEEQTKKILMLGGWTVTLLILVVVIANFTLQQSEAHEMYIRLQAEVAHPLREDAFDVLVRDLNDNFNIMKNLQTNNYFIRLSKSFLITAPTFLVFIYFTSLTLKQAGAKFYFIVLAILASLSPLVMHLWGWDIYRWNTLTGTVSFLMLSVAYTTNKNKPIETPNYMFLIVISVIILNGMSSIPLFDNYYVKQFPFLEHWQYLIDLIGGKATFPYVPSR